jgi:hypothetical protein
MKHRSDCTPFFSFFSFLLFFAAAVAAERELNQLSCERFQAISRLHLSETSEK